MAGVGQDRAAGWFQCAFYIGWLGFMCWLERAEWLTFGHDRTVGAWAACACAAHCLRLGSCLACNLLLQSNPVSDLMYTTERWLRLSVPLAFAGHQGVPGLGPRRGGAHHRHHRGHRPVAAAAAAHHPGGVGVAFLCVVVFSYLWAILAAEVQNVASVLQKGGQTRPDASLAAPALFRQSSHLAHSNHLRCTLPCLLAGCRWRRQSRRGWLPAERLRRRLAPR